MPAYQTTAVRNCNKASRDLSNDLRDSGLPLDYYVKVVLGKSNSHICIINALESAVFRDSNLFFVCCRKESEKKSAGQRASARAQDLSSRTNI